MGGLLGQALGHILPFRMGGKVKKAKAGKKKKVGRPKKTNRKK